MNVRKRKGEKEKRTGRTFQERNTPRAKKEAKTREGRVKRRVSTGYNWRNTLTQFAAIGGVLAGFCVAFIALTLGGQVADIEICTSGVTFGQISVLLFGISTGLFISAVELFLCAKEFDVFDIPQPYRKLLKEDCEQKKKDWSEFEDEQTAKCRRNELLGRRCYNSAIFIIFGGLFFAIAPYNIVIAVVVAGLGISLELWQMLR